jgi:hypothetical protein
MLSKIGTLFVALAGAWFTVAGALVSLAACCAGDHDKNFILYVVEIKERVAIVLSSVIYYGFRFADRILGKRLLSVKAYLISLLLSIVFGILSFSLALLTSSSDFRKFLLTAMQNNFEWLTIAYFALALWCGLTVDFFFGV